MEFEKAAGYDYGERDLAVAAIIAPTPPISDYPTAALQEWVEDLEALAGGVSLVSDTSGVDPVLDYLRMLRAERDQAVRRMVLLVAYMRERTGPKPYTLAAAAEAAGLTPSGVRTFYSSADVAELDERIELARRSLEGDLPGFELAAMKERLASLREEGDAIARAIERLQQTDDPDDDGSDGEGNE